MSKKNILIAAAAIGITAAAGTLAYRKRDKLAPVAMSLKDRMVPMAYALRNRFVDFLDKLTRNEERKPQLVAAE